MIRVQGPRDQDFYYKPKHRTEYSVQYWLDGVLVETIDTVCEPDPQALWRENFAQAYPGVETL